MSSLSSTSVSYNHCIARLVDIMLIWVILVAMVAYTETQLAYLRS